MRFNQQLCVVCSILIGMVGMHIIKYEWFLPSYLWLPLCGFRCCHIPLETPFDFTLSQRQLQDSGNGMLIMTKKCNAALRVDCLTWNCSRLFLGFFFFFVSLFRCWLKNIYRWHSVNDVLYWKHVTYFSTSIILMNKAQNAQIQVNSHVVFTVYLSLPAWLRAEFSWNTT